MGRFCYAGGKEMKNNMAQRRHGIKWWSKKENLDKIQAWAARGLVMREIAEKMGISRSTLYEWINKSQDISDSCARGGAEADENVEGALFKKCTGYNAIIKKPIKVRRIKYENGKKVEEYEEIVEAEEEVHVPADSAAQKFWLTNRQPEKWQIAPAIESADGEGAGVVMLAPVINSAPPIEAKGEEVNEE